MAHARNDFKDSNWLHTILLIGGGLLCGHGIVLLIFSFGFTDATGNVVPLNTNFAEVGFNGLDNLHPLGMFDLSVPMVVVGLIAMIFANATAWKRTGGY